MQQVPKIRDVCQRKTSTPRSSRNRLGGSGFSLPYISRHCSPRATRSTKPRQFTRADTPPPAKNSYPKKFRLPRHRKQRHQPQQQQNRSTRMVTMVAVKIGIFRTSKATSGARRSVRWQLGSPRNSKRQNIQRHGRGTRKEGWRKNSRRGDYYARGACARRETGRGAPPGRRA